MRRVKQLVHQLYVHHHFAAEGLLKILESRCFRLLTYGWFLFQAIYIAISTNWRIVPDASAHLGRIRLFARDGVDPLIQNQQGFHFLGDMIRNPDILYHYVFSLVYRILPFESTEALGNQLPETETPTIIVFEFLNIGLVLAGLVVFYKIMKRLGLSALVRNISLFMMTNTLMFIFLAGGINYDNLLFLVAMSVFYFFVVFMQTRSFKSGLALLTLLAIAGLTKTAFLPIGVVVFAATAFLTVRHRQQIIEEVKNVSRQNSRQKISVGFLVMLLLIFGGMFAERYAVNIVEYGAIQPGCMELHTEKQCSKSAIFTRAQKFEKKDPTYKYGPAEFSIQWTKKMRSYTFTAIGHKAFSETNLIKYGSYAFILFMTIATIVKFDKRKKELNILLLIGIYFLVVLLGVNYFGAYRNSGIFGIALQGRYVFPVLPLLYAAGNHYVYRLLSLNGLKVAYSMLILLIFLPSGLLNYIFWTDKSWHTEYTPEIHHSIQQKLRRLNTHVIDIFY